MLPLAVALQLALASPGLEVPDPGPFRGGELAAASLGALTGDALVLSGGYLALQGFASGAISPTATNFRRAAYGFLGAAVLVPPLTAVLLARATGRPTSGTMWKAFALAAIGEVAALGVGYLAAPHFWLILPVQLTVVAAGTSVGLHWGPRGSMSTGEDSARHEPANAPGPEPGGVRTSATLFTPVCPDA